MAEPTITLTIPTEYGDWPCSTTAEHLTIIQDINRRHRAREFAASEKLLKQTVANIRLFAAEPQP